MGKQEENEKEFKEIKDIFEKEGFVISKQAAAMISNLAERDEKINDIIGQAKVRKFKIAGGDILMYLLKGTISPSIKNSEDV